MRANVVLVVFLFSSLAATAAPNLKPGLWETKSTMRTEGLRAERNSSGLICIGAEELKSPVRLLPTHQEGGMGCRNTDVQFKTDQASWVVTCMGKGKSMIGVGSMKMKGESYRAEISYQLQDGATKRPVSHVIEAKRTGPCK